MGKADLPNVFYMIFSIQFMNIELSWAKAESHSLYNNDKITFFQIWEKKF